MVYRTIHLSIATLLAGVIVSSADMVIKQVTRIDGYSIMGTTVPASEKISIIKMAKDRARVDVGSDTAMIIRLDKKALYSVDVKSKTYQELPLQDLSSTMENAIDDQEGDMTAEEKEQAKAMMRSMTSSMQMVFKVTPTAEKKKIRSWDCTKYLLTTTIAGMKTTSELWAAPGIKIDMDFYNKVMHGYLAKMPGMETMALEMGKVKGLTVLMTSSVELMGTKIKTIQEVTEVAEKGVPAGDYEIPAGFKKMK